ncbi:MAG: LuxR C-terminal-related transcriptional regulator [Candidatus Kapaibacterium sp.]
MNYTPLTRRMPPPLVLNSASFDAHSSRHRRKRHLAWEQAELASGGVYSRNLEAIERCYPALTPMELRVCALVKAMLPSWKIAELLGVCEETVENHRVNARRKMRLSGESLAKHLAHL